MNPRKLILAVTIAAGVITLPARSAAQTREATRFPFSAAAPTSYKLQGAVGGLIAGAGATALALYSGGSTSLCNRSENQDAMSSGDCAALIVGGGVVGAMIGYVIGSRIQRDYRVGLQTAPAGKRLVFVVIGVSASRISMPADRPISP